jgi:hypothetical protein
MAKLEHHLKLLGTYNTIYILSMVEVYTHMPPYKSLLEGRLSAQLCGVKGLANYYNNNNCAKYLPHPAVLLPVVCTSTLGEDNDRRDQLHRHEWRAFRGGEVWMTVILEQQITAPTIPSIGQKGGHGGAVVVHGVNLRSVYHRKYHVWTLYFMCFCPEVVLICWDKMLQLLQCHRHCLASCNVNG